MFISAGLYSVMAAFLILVFFLILDRLAGYVAASRRSAPDAGAWKEVVFAAHCWVLGGALAPFGWRLMTQSYVAPESGLVAAVIAVGAAIALLGAVFFLYGASSLMTARALFREAGLKDETPP